MVGREETRAKRDEMQNQISGSKLFVLLVLDLSFSPSLSFPPLSRIWILLLRARKTRLMGTAEESETTSERNDSLLNLNLSTSTSKLKNITETSPHSPPAAAPTAPSASRTRQLTVPTRASQSLWRFSPPLPRNTRKSASRTSSSSQARPRSRSPVGLRSR